ncbi:MAG: His/Gly/Thr/Pro-type tRNA ligase C-terminal domain-containing protein, partial [Holdemanella porci]|nr:His/Gly/Thr/Pro-type tRNA ligase C-terminal domain-containing protein [Holdemanella porci]
FQHGIEVGNLFKLGTKYSKSMNLYYTDANNQLQPVWMGSYGIGLERCMAAVADQHHDDFGIKWPVEIAPFRLAIVPVSLKDEEQVKIANDLYEFCKEHKFDVILDDRNERPGVKFKDMELIGVPYRITVGRGVKEGKLEWTDRYTGEKTEIAIEDVYSEIEKVFAM